MQVNCNKTGLFKRTQEAESRDLAPHPMLSPGDTAYPIKSVESYFDKHSKILGGVILGSHSTLQACFLISKSWVMAPAILSL